MKEEIKKEVEKLMNDGIKYYALWDRRAMFMNNFNMLMVKNNIEINSKLYFEYLNIYNEGKKGLFGLFR